MAGAARLIDEIKIRVQRLYSEHGYLVGAGISKSICDLQIIGNRSFIDVLNAHKEELVNHPSYLQREAPTEESSLFTRPTKAVSAMSKTEAKVFVTELLTFLLGGLHQKFVGKRKD